MNKQWEPRRFDARSGGHTGRCETCTFPTRALFHSREIVEIRCLNGHSYWPHNDGGTMVKAGTR